MAFCYWLSWKIGAYPDVNAIAKGVLSPIHLPTEQEWQRAAQGDDGRKYPWGNQEPTKDLCNFNFNVDQTSPVTHYPKGASPFGALDMAGNVWEWCLTAWGRDDININNILRRVVRGGSWYGNTDYVRCAFRHYFLPSSSHYHVGCRVGVWRS
jgi:formylglycine-generating enzyme required for sulfatase activity